MTSRVSILRVRPFGTPRALAACPVQTVGEAVGESSGTPAQEASLGTLRILGRVSISCAACVHDFCCTSTFKIDLSRARSPPSSCQSESTRPTFAAQRSRAAERFLPTAVVCAPAPVTLEDTSASRDDDEDASLGARILAVA